MKKISLWVVERAGALWGGVEGGFFLHEDELMKLGREVEGGGAKSRARRQILVWYLPSIN